MAGGGLRPASLPIRQQTIWPHQRPAGAGRCELSPESAIRQPDCRVAFPGNWHCGIVANCVLTEENERINMSLDTYCVFANEYDRESDALADYDAVRKLYTDLKIIDTYDAAVVTRQPNGDVKIVKRVEEPTRHGAAIGLAVGVAVGLAVALFPPLGVALGAGMLGGGAAGAVVGAVTGHVARGMKRSDLMKLGEILDQGTSGLLVVAAADVEQRVNAAITRAKKGAKAQLQADTDALKQAIDDIGKKASASRRGK